MPTIVDTVCPGLTDTRCSYCGKYGHQASHHPDYQTWKAATLAEFHASQLEKRLDPEPVYRPRLKRREGESRQDWLERRRQVRGLLSPGKYPRQPKRSLQKECLWCGDDFNPWSRDQTYCSRECYHEDRRERTLERLKEKEAEEQVQAAVLVTVETKLQPEPGDGFALADLSDTMLSCPGTGEVDHPFTVSELEEIDPSDVSDVYVYKDDFWGLDWGVINILKPAAVGVRKRARKRAVKTKRTPCRPPAPRSPVPGGHSQGHT